MQTRYRAAATALLMTATAGMAATGGAAEASGTHHAGDKAAKSLTVTIKSTGKGPHTSTDKIRPGFTTFKIVRKAHGNAALEVLRLKKGYTLKELKRDVPKITADVVNVHAVRRIDKHVVFYGGGDVFKPAPVAKFAMDIDKAGKYYVVDIFTLKTTSFHAKGHHQKRSHPTADGSINAAPGNVWNVSADLPEKGWMKTKNNAQEPHFVNLDAVDPGATDQDVADWFANPAGPPPFDPTRPSFGTEVVSPGHTVYWKYASAGGRYVADCFFPSMADGMPHAFMGMFKVTTFGTV